MPVSSPRCGMHLDRARVPPWCHRPPAISAGVQRRRRGVLGGVRRVLHVRARRLRARDRVRRLLEALPQGVPVRVAERAALHTLVVQPALRRVSVLQPTRHGRGELSAVDRSSGVGQLVQKVGSRVDMYDNNIRYRRAPKMQSTLQRERAEGPRPSQCRLSLRCAYVCFTTRDQNTQKRPNYIWRGPGGLATPRPEPGTGACAPPPPPPPPHPQNKPRPLLLRLHSSLSPPPTSSSLTYPPPLLLSRWRVAPRAPRLV